jgi:DNA-binding NarL/FixJ family response regulator
LLIDDDHECPGFAGAHMLSKKSDSGFGRLANAWGTVFHAGVFDRKAVAPAANESQPAWSQFPAVEAAVQGRADGSPIRVLIAARASGSGLALRLGRFEAYSFASSGSASADDLERQILAQRPRLVLLDSALAGELGVAKLRDLTHVLPASQWIILWDAASSRGLELAVACRARGGIEWQSSPDLYIQALRTVLGGELWFPREAMYPLYLSLVAASEQDECRAAVSTFDYPANMEALTEREVQITSLMRRGLTNQEIADRLCISINTVKKHLMHAYEKCGSNHRRQFRA